MNIRFRENWWMGEKYLAECYPLLFKLSSHKEKSISEFVENSQDPSGDALNWKFHFIQNLKEREVPQVANLLAIIDGVRLNVGVEDSRCRKADSSEIYSCLSAFHALLDYDVHPRAIIVSKIWKVKVLIKLSGCFAKAKTISVDFSKLVCYARKMKTILITCLYTTVSHSKSGLEF